MSECQHKEVNPCEWRCDDCSEFFGEKPDGSRSYSDELSEQRDDLLAALKDFMDNRPAVKHRRGREGRWEEWQVDYSTMEKAEAAIAKAQA